MSVVEIRARGIEASSPLGIVNKPLSFALILSFILHLSVIGLAFLFLKEINPPGIQPSTQSFEISLLKTPRVQNDGTDSQVVLPAKAYTETVEVTPILRNEETESSEILGEPRPSSIETFSTSAISSKPQLISPRPIESIENQPMTKEIELVQQVSLLEQLEKSDVLNKGGGFTAEMEVDGRLYSVKIGDLQAENDTDLESVNLEISTLMDGQNLSTKMTMKRLAFSSYVQVINRWDPDVTFSQDVIEGRFHSNTRINVANDRHLEPTFTGKASISSGFAGKGNSRQKRIFRGGLETRVKRIRFPQPLLSDLPHDESLIHVVDADVNITFLDDGQYRWYLEGSPSDVFFKPYSDSTRYILGSEKVKLSVRGKVKGSIVVHALDRISISGSLTYVDNPEKNPYSKDYLGLISQNYVEIDSPDVTGRGDITVQAAIFAKRRFVIRRSRARTNALLSVFGSLSAGTISASEPRFSTSLIFDRRFEDRKLPGFPVTNKYELEDWDAQWHLETRKEKL